MLGIFSCLFGKGPLTFGGDERKGLHILRCCRDVRVDFRTVLTSVLQNRWLIDFGGNRGVVKRGALSC